MSFRRTIFRLSYMLESGLLMYSVWRDAGQFDISNIGEGYWTDLR